MSEEEIKNIVESGEKSSWTSHLQRLGQKASDTASALSNKIKESETIRRMSTTVGDAAKVVYEKTEGAAKVVYEKTGDAAKVVYNKTGDAAKSFGEKASSLSNKMKESETIQKVSTTVGDAAKVVYDKTSDAAKVISIRAGQGYVEAKRQTAVAWKAGTSELSKLREKAKQRYPQYFQSSGEETATIQAFREALASGFEGVEVKAGQSFQLPFRVDEDKDLGDKILVWEFFLWKYDVNFKVVMRTMSVGGAVERDVFNGGKVKTSEESIKGQYVPKEGGTIALIWDNTSSWLRSKHIAYRVRLISEELLKKEEEAKKKQVAEVAAASTKQVETPSSSEKKKRDSIHLEQAASPVQLSNSLEEDDSAVPIELDLPPPGTVSSSNKKKSSIKMPPKLFEDEEDLDSTTDKVSEIKLSPKKDGSIAF